MRFLVLANSAVAYGGCPPCGALADFLYSRTGDYGSAIGEIEVVICLRGGRVRNSTLQAGYDRFHAVFLPTLPLVKFLRRESRVVVEFESKVTDATLFERREEPSAALFSSLLSELIRHLRSISGRLKKQDSFDFALFVSDLEQACQESPRTDEELNLLRIQLESERRTRFKGMDPWERLDIEWDEYHPRARAILDDPFFWDCADDYAPHGNDTGADLLSAFQKWNSKNPSRPAHEMARGLLRSWDIADMDSVGIEDARILALSSDEAIAMEVTDAALIAAAFAAVKYRGDCDQESVAAALRAIQRERLLAKAGQEAGRDLSERLTRLELVEKTLLKSPG